MSSYIKILTDDLEKGYSKSDLEKLIGLPKNNLSGILKGDRKLSKKSQLKIDNWEKSEKPNPLELVRVKKLVKENNKPEYKKTILEERNGGKDSHTKSFTVRAHPVSEGEAIPPMPVRNEGEDAFDFAQRKNEWKRLYQK